MNQVEYHLKLVIYLWCGAVPTQYTIDSQLRDIWKAQGSNLDYDTYGVPKFMAQLYADALFGPCPAAHSMTPGEFITGGDLQTVRSVYTRLLACGSTALMSSVTLPFAESVLTERAARKAAKKSAPKKTTKR